MEPNLKENKISCIFEIDVHDLNEHGIDYEAIKDVLNRLRELKNNIFYANLPNAKEMFK